LRGECFRYVGLEIDEQTGVLECQYELDGRAFVERVRFEAGGDWSQPAAREGARLTCLLAGVSYYKATAPETIDLGTLPIRPAERDFLRAYFVDGLGEFAFTNGLDLRAIEIVGGTSAPPAAALELPLDRPLIPFGGGIDSIVTVELLRDRFPESALFILSRPNDPFAAIERAAAITATPIVRAERELDPQILRSTEYGWFNGHVPITGILSAIAVTAAVLDGRGAVVMSNEWSASSSNLTHHGHPINHQYSKSLSFENGWRDVLAGSVGRGFEYFSELRPFSELWIARQFAALTQYHRAVHSCNRAFHQDPARRQDSWCGQCDKCCFIDLILAPFLPAGDLRDIFSGREPLDDPALLDQFRTLLDLSDQPKPFECVGDVAECRAAAQLAGARADRRDNAILAALLTALPSPAGPPSALLRPLGPHHIPDAFLPATALV
jgi:hypothetical protein